MDRSKFHKSFKLNGNSFKSKNELLEFSKIISSSVFLFLKDWFSNSDDVSVQTSGSTGKPKKIKLKKEYMVHSALATGSFFELHENTTALLCLSTDFIAGKMMLVRAMTLGWHIDIVEASSNPLKRVGKEYDFCAMVPLQVENSLADLHKIKKLIVGGASVSNSLIMQLQAIPIEIYATYGMTETITHIAVKPLNKYAMSLRGGTMWQSQHYKTIPNVIIAKDHRDCLIINAPKLSDTQIITNDIVEIISENEFKWIGRYDNIINSGAVKLVPEQIEKKLAVIIKDRFFVYGFPDKRLGEKLVLVIENRDIRYKIQDIRYKIQDLKSLNTYEIPKEIFFVNKFKETKSRKIDRKRIIIEIEK